jgi:hypothetical protein
MPRKKAATRELFDEILDDQPRPELNPVDIGRIKQSGHYYSLLDFRAFIGAKQWPRAFLNKNLDAIALIEHNQGDTQVLYTGHRTEIYVSRIILLAYAVDCGFSEYRFDPFFAGIIQNPDMKHKYNADGSLKKVKPYVRPTKPKPVDPVDHSNASHGTTIKRLTVDDLRDAAKARRLRDGTKTQHTYSAVRGKFNVNAYTDIPPHKYPEVLVFINHWKQSYSPYTNNSEIKIGYLSRSRNEARKQALTDIKTSVNLIMDSTDIYRGPLTIH